MSLDQNDITNLNSANSQTLHSLHHGHKFGQGRCVFTATGGKATGAHGMGLTVPKGCSVTRCIYKVLTTFTSPTTDDATIALHLVAANDVISAVSIDTGTTWDASIPIVCIPVTATLSTWLHTTVDSEFTATVGVEALTAGKLVLFAEWFYWGDLSLTA